MKKVKFYLFISLTVMFVANSFSQEVSKNSKNDIAVAKFECSVKCNNCKQKIMDNIPYEQGVKNVKVNLETKIVVIEYKKSKNTAENLEKALQKLDFETKNLNETDTIKKHNNCIHHVKNKPCNAPKH
ncbi:MAG: cation transporter [Bacteroidales bacterium]|nr:cation transporter [Bacteroidales bacterium]